MMPQFIPTHTFSARCASNAIARASHGSCALAANARAAASSMAALVLKVEEDLYFVENLITLALVVGVLALRWPFRRAPARAEPAPA